MKKRLLATTVLSLSMFVPVLAQAGQTKAPSAGTTQTVEVTRGGQEHVNGKVVEWMEKVSDEQYLVKPGRP